MIRKGRGSGSRSGEPFLFRPLCPCILRGLGSLSLTSPRSPLASPSKAGLRSPQRAKKRDEDNRHDRPFVLKRCPEIGSGRRHDVGWGIFPRALTADSVAPAGVGALGKMPGLRNRSLDGIEDRQGDRDVIYG